MGEWPSRNWTASSSRRALHAGCRVSPHLHRHDGRIWKAANRFEGCHAGYRVFPAVRPRLLTGLILAPPPGTALPLLDWTKAQLRCGAAHRSLGKAANARFLPELVRLDRTLLEQVQQ